MAQLTRSILTIDLSVASDPEGDKGHAIGQAIKRFKEELPGLDDDITVTTERKIYTERTESGPRKPRAVKAA